MIYLVIDTSSINLLISIVRDDTILSFSKLENVTGLSTKLLPEIRQSLIKEGLFPDDIDTIFVVNGPGSFTGLRVGVTVAKTLAYSLNKKIIPISSLELMATTEFTQDYIIPYIDARRDYVYAGIYDRELNIYKEDSYISIDELINCIPPNKNVVYTGYTDVNKINRMIPSENILKIIQKHKSDKGINPHKVNPNYLKKTEAEEKLYHDKMC